jgi:hypothetical protein
VDAGSSRLGPPPAPASVAEKASDAVGEGRGTTKRDVPLVTDVVHRLYGIVAVGAALAARDR